MALAGSVHVPVDEHLTLSFHWAAAQDPVAGGSWIYWWLRHETGDMSLQALGKARWEVVIDGQRFQGTDSITIPKNSVRDLASGSVFLAHDAFGEKAFSFSFTQQYNLPTDEGVLPEASGSGEGILDTLDLEAAPLVLPPRVVLGDTLTITPQGPLEATYRLRYILGTEQGIIGENLTGTVDWVVPETLGDQFPYTLTAPLRILCDTFRDGAPYGKTRETTVEVGLPDWAVPQISQLRLVDGSPAANLGVLVKNVSRVSLEARIEGALGSRIINIRATLDGEPLGLCRQAGVREILVSATDSRGRVGQARMEVEVLDYLPPSVTVAGHRCQEDGTPDDTGAWAMITVTPEWIALPNTQPQLTLNAGTFSETWVPDGPRSVLVEAPEDLAMAVTAALSDGLTVGYGELALSTAYCVLDVLYGGKGLAIGTVAREPGFRCAMDARFDGKIFLPDGSELMERLARMGS